MAVLTLAPTVGTQTDMAARLRALLPGGWFADSAPVLDGVLAGLAAAWAASYAQLDYAAAQARIATATDIFLDLIAQDFFGTTLTRRAAETDDALRARIGRSLLPAAATRPALQAALLDLCGRMPTIFEPARIADSGAYNLAATRGYNVAGGYGSFALPFQLFVIAYRPVGTGVAATAGYGSPAAGYGVGAGRYTTPTMAATTVRDADIQAAMATTLPAGTTGWIAISN